MDRGKESDSSRLYASDPNKRDHVHITQIRITNVMSGLRRVPAGFYVAVDMNRNIMKTDRKSVSASTDVGWDVKILLPLERSCSVSFKMFACFDSGPDRRNGVLLRRFKTTVGDVRDRKEDLQPATFLDKDCLKTCSTLRVVTEAPICDIYESTTRLEMQDSEVLSQLAHLTDAGYRALTRYPQSQDRRDLDEAITSFERARDICPERYPDESTVLFNLATTRFIHCQDNGRYDDLKVSISLYQRALALRTSDRPHHAVTALELCFALLKPQERSKREGAKVPHFALVQSYAFRAAWLALQMAGISVQTQAVQTRTSYVRDANSDDEQWIRWGRSMLQDLSNRDPRRPAVLSGLGVAYSQRFRRSRDLVDIDRGISLLEDALKLTSDRQPQRAAQLNCLGEALCDRFEFLGEIDDIEKSIAVLRQAMLLTPNGDPDRPGYMSSLGTSLFQRYERFGDHADITKSVSVLEEAVRLTPNDHPDKPARLSSLGSSLVRRFERVGDLADIDRSIATLEAAIGLIPNTHPQKPDFLQNLGSSLSHRFEQLGDISDVQKFVLVSEEAVRLTPNGHPGKPSRLNNLGNSLTRRFERQGHLADINKSIATLEEAVHLIPSGHPAKPTALVNLGSSLSRRYLRLGDIADIKQSIWIFEEAIRLTPNDHLKKPAWLTSLGNSLFLRFERHGNLTDVDRSIANFEEAIRLIPNYRPDKPGVLGGLGNSLIRRFATSRPT